MLQNQYVSTISTLSILYYSICKVECSDPWVSYSDSLIYLESTELPWLISQYQGQEHSKYITHAYIVIVILEIQQLENQPFGDLIYHLNMFVIQIDLLGNDVGPTDINCRGQELSKYIRHVSIVSSILEIH